MVPEVFWRRFEIEIESTLKGSTFLTPSWDTAVPVWSAPHDLEVDPTEAKLHRICWRHTD